MLPELKRRAYNLNLTREIRKLAAALANIHVESSRPENVSAPIHLPASGATRSKTAKRLKTDRSTSGGCYGCEDYKQVRRICDNNQCKNWICDNHSKKICNNCLDKAFTSAAE